MRRRVTFAAVGAIVVLAGVVMVLATSSGDESTQGGGSEQVTTTTRTFPYDFVEATGDLEVKTLEQAKFASLTLLTADGYASYLLSAGSTEFTTVLEALKEAEEKDGSPVPTEASGGSTDETDPTGLAGSTLTFVMNDRTTYTLNIDLEEGRLYRGNQTWEPQTDLNQLLQRSIAPPSS